MRREFVCFAASRLHLKRVAALVRLRSARAAPEAGGDASVAEARFWPVAREIRYGNRLSCCQQVTVDVWATLFGLRCTLVLTERPQKSSAHESLKVRVQPARTEMHERAVGRDSEPSPARLETQSSERAGSGWLGGGKLAPQFCARGGGAGLPSAHQRGATSAKKRRTNR